MKTKGSNAARFRRLVTDHYDFVWRALRGLGITSTAAGDAAQQVFLVAAQKIDVIAAGSERSFLFAIARGVAANARRTASRRREVSDEGWIAAVRDEADPEQLTVHKHLRELLDRVLASLADDVRDVFVLFEFEGMTMAEIATILAIPRGTVASRLRRARSEFNAAAQRFQEEERELVDGSRSRRR